MIAQLPNCYLSRWQKLPLICLASLLLTAVVFRMMVSPHWLTTYYCECFLSCIDRTPLDSAALLVALPASGTSLVITQCAPGLSKRQVQTLIGAPKFKERKLAFPCASPDIRDADEVHFYEILPNTLLLLGFKGDECRFARHFLSGEETAYSYWKAEQIQELGRGQTRYELEAWLGRCFVDDSHFVRQVLLSTGQEWAREATWAEGDGRFYLSDSEYIGLEMKDERLASTQVYAIFH